MIVVAAHHSVSDNENPQISCIHIQPIAAAARLSGGSGSPIAAHTKSKGSLAIEYSWPRKRAPARISSQQAAELLNQNGTPCPISEPYRTRSSSKGSLTLRAFALELSAMRYFRTAA